MRENIRIGDHFYILASSLSVGVHKYSLKDEEAFLVCDNRGDFPGTIGIWGELGFYFAGCRYLDQLELKINGFLPLPLFSSVAEDGCEFIAQMTNAETTLGDGARIPHNTIFVERRISLCRNNIFQTISTRNFHKETFRCRLDISYDSDFADVFEVRGITRESRGKKLPSTTDNSRTVLSYQGLDGIRRSTVLCLEPSPESISECLASYNLELAPGQEEVIRLKITAQEGDELEAPGLGHKEALSSLRSSVARWRQSCPTIYTSNEQFNDFINRSLTDFRMMLTTTPQGLYPFGGIPWYVAPFGRDGIIAALQMLPFQPQVAAGTLKFLAAHQGSIQDDFLDQEPGKILHEYRRGEMANLREIPFIPYYGSVDATPLFLVLLGSYLARTGDTNLLESLWPNALAANAWIDDYGDLDNDGFVEYRSRSDKGLINQGWKDSPDSIFHSSGELAPPPIALVEVQGYVYAAKMAMARLALLRGEGELAREFKQQAEALRSKFHQAFWMPERNFYALALDGDKRQCQAISSNPGHCLWAGLVDQTTADLVAQRLMAPDMFGGWGIRTLSEREARYNPLSYHNGSVWPHDNAIIAAGFARYGLTEPLIKVATGLFDVSLFQEGSRLPELFCGLPRILRHGPASYPISCKPQAWAAGSIFQTLTALMGMEVDAINGKLRFVNPVLPPWLLWVEVNGLKVGDAGLDFTVRRGKLTSSIELNRRWGELEVVVTK